MVFWLVVQGISGAVDGRGRVVEDGGMKMIKTSFIAVTVLSLGLVVAACSQKWQKPEVTRIDAKTGEVQTKNGLKEIEAGTIKTFPDLPLPATHKIDLDRSVIFHSNNQALGKVVAAGGGDLPSVFAFYQEEMPRKGWTLVNSFQSNVGNLYYARPGTFVAITIEPTGRGSRVTMNIGPE